MREYKEIYSLEGRTLKSGWKVLHKIEPRDNRQKGKFSVCYMVEKDGEQRFMKVMDINELFVSILVICVRLRISA